MSEKAPLYFNLRNMKKTSEMTEQELKELYNSEVEKYLKVWFTKDAINDFDKWLTIKKENEILRNEWRISIND